MFSKMTHFQTFICSKSALETLKKDTKYVQKTAERRHCHRLGIFKVNFEHIFKPFCSASIVDFN